MLGDKINEDKWAGHEVHIGEKRNAHRNLMGNSEGKGSYGKVYYKNSINEFALDFI